jgi:hypothetical protein
MCQYKLFELFWIITIHSCDLSTVSISCENGHVIAVQSLDFRYEPTCDTTCCKSAAVTRSLKQLQSKLLMSDVFALVDKHAQ